MPPPCAPDPGFEFSLALGFGFAAPLAFFLAVFATGEAALALPTEGFTLVDELPCASTDAAPEGNA